MRVLKQGRCDGCRQLRGLLYMVKTNEGDDDDVYNHALSFLTLLPLDA